MKKVSVIIPSGGSGSRMGANESKQFLQIKNKPILKMTIEKFTDFEEIKEIIVVSSERDMDKTIKIINSIDFKGNIKFALGGGTRQESVYNGLKEINENNDVVLIHDGARPLIGHEEIRKCILEVSEEIGVVLGVPVKDTIKMVDSTGTIVNTPKRDKMWIAQTPQGFYPQSILKAHKSALSEKFLATDDSSIMERYGHRVKIIQGKYSNIKITTPDDMAIANRLIEMESES